MADKNSDSDAADLEPHRRSMFDAVLVERKNVNEKDRCSRVQEYLDKGVDVNALDGDRNTVLHIAVKRGFEKVVQFLLDKSALTDIKNIQGDTAISLAEKPGKQKIAGILKAPNGIRHGRLPSATQTQISDDHDHGLRSCSGFGEGSAERDQPRNRDEENIRQNPRWDTKDTYGTSANNKSSSHGYIYQVWLLVLALYHAWQKNYAFRLATEFTSAGKFDDLVFEYEDREGKRTHYFVQLKHRLDRSKQIGANELLIDGKGDFGMQMYFNSWLKVSKHKTIAGSKSKCFILCTNARLNESDLKAKQIELIPVENGNEFLNITDTEKQGSCYKLRADKNSKLYEKLMCASDLYQLAHALAKCVNDSKASPLNPDIFKRYYTALAREVLVGDYGQREQKFNENFIKNIDLSRVAKTFRNIFIERLRQFPSYNSLSEGDIWTHLEKKIFTTPKSSGKSTAGSQQDQLDDLPDDHISVEDISVFLDEFILAVNQPNEQELGKAIKRAFGENSPFNLSNTDFVGDSLQIMTLDWFKQDKYLVREDIEAFLDEMKRKISSLITVGLNLHYLSELKNYDVQFKSEVKDLRTFPGSTNSAANLIWQVIPFEQTLLTALRVYQTLDQMEEYKKDDSFIFIKLEKFLLPEITRQVFLAFLSSGSQRLLAIDCGSDSTRQDMEQLQKNLDDIITKSREDKITGKRIILILRKKDARVIRMKQDHTIPEAEGDVSIDNLEKATQRKLLRKKVIRFQEREQKISFMDLFGIDNLDDVAEEKLADYRRVISPKTLVRLIRGEELRIGEKSEGLGEVAEYYIPRTIDRRVVINRRIFIDPEMSDMFAVSGIAAEALEKLLTNGKRTNEISGRTTQNHLAVKYRILKKGRELEHFDRLCQRRSDLIIHWLQWKDKKFILMRSFGSSTNLLGYRDETRCRNCDNGGRVAIPFSLSEEQLAEYNEQRKIVIISDTSGTGKSIVSTRAAEKIWENEPHLLVIKIDLPSYTRVLAVEEKERSFHKNDVNGAVDFLVDKLIPNLEREDASLYKTIIKVQRKVVLLFDGFDEISPDYKETVIDLLQALAKLEVKQLFVTTRPHTCRVLEEKLGVFSYALQRFSPANQIEFLTQFWKMISSTRNSDSRPLKSRDLREHAQNVIDSLAKSIDPSMMDFTGVPLQTRMVAEVFPFEKSTVLTTITIAEMYSKFILMKLNIHSQGKKRADSTNLAVKSSSEWERKWFLMMLQRIALALLFGERVAMLLSPQINDFDETWEEMVKDQERTGIVTLQRNGRFRFIHRTFAEYLAATFIFEMFLTGGCNRAHEVFVGGLLVCPEYRGVRVFLNCLLIGKNVPLRKNSWSFDVITHRNVKGETAYHVAARERHVGITKFLLNSVVEHHGVPFSNVNCLSFNGEPPLIVAVKMKDNLDVVKCLIDAGARVNDRDLSWEEKTALHVSVRTDGNVNVVRYLIENRADIESRDKIGEVPLHYAAKSGHLNVSQYLLDKGADINSQSKDGGTPLHCAAGSGHLDLVKYLTERGANIHSQSKHGETPLAYAGRARHLDVVQYLAKRGAYIHPSCSDAAGSGNQATFESTKHAMPNNKPVDATVMKDSTERRADINSQSNGHLMWQANQLFQYFGLIFYIFNSCESSYLHWMAWLGAILHVCVRTVKYLVDRWVDTNSERFDVTKPLMFTAFFFFFTLMTWL